MYSIQKKKKKKMIRLRTWNIARRPGMLVAAAWRGLTILFTATTHQYQSPEETSQVAQLTLHWNDIIFRHLLSSHGAFAEFSQVFLNEPFLIEMPGLPGYHRLLRYFAGDCKYVNDKISNHRPRNFQSSFAKMKYLNTKTQTAHLLAQNISALVTTRMKGGGHKVGTHNYCTFRFVCLGCCGGHNTHTHTQSPHTHTQNTHTPEHTQTSPAKEATQHNATGRRAQFA
jgi:hypothetical protein